jgi:hypothetical protein
MTVFPSCRPYKAERVLERSEFETSAKAPSGKNRNTDKTQDKIPSKSPKKTPKKSVGRGKKPNRLFPRGFIGLCCDEEQVVIYTSTIPL